MQVVMTEETRNA